MTFSHEFVRVKSTSNEMGVDFTFTIKDSCVSSENNSYYYSQSMCINGIIVNRK